MNISFNERKPWVKDTLAGNLLCVSLFIVVFILPALLGIYFEHLKI